MPRPFVFGNGSLFIACDEHHQIRELCWPHIGWPNHLSGRAIKWGVWSRGRMLWSFEPEWQFEFSYDDNRVMGRTRAVFGDEIELLIEEWIHPTEAVFYRRFQVVSSQENRVGLFMSHQPQLFESSIADTCLYLPEIEAIAHYKGACWMGFGFDRPMAQFACGTTDVDGQEGCWRDAEDDHLSDNPISQGSVDSVACVHLDFAGGEKAVLWRMACAESEADLVRLWPANGEPEAFQTDWPNLPEGWAEMAGRSLAFVRAHCDQGGAIMAACDSDIMISNTSNYASCWPRDAALTGLLLSDRGETEAVNRLLDFLENVLPKNPALFHQKYRVDRTEASSWHPRFLNGERVIPVQLDESALALILGCRHKRTALIDPLKSALAEHWMMPSWDLWEERRAVHFFTLCVIARGLRDAGEIDTAREIIDWMAACLTTEGGVYARNRSHPEGDLDPTPDASALLGMLFLPELLETSTGQKTVDLIDQELTSQNGGICRYTGDWYFRQENEEPNPWIICTLWLARVRLRQGRRDEAEKLIQWCLDQAASTGALPEQVHVRTGQPLSVSPLTWSHSELIETMLAWS